MRKSKFFNMTITEDDRKAIEFLAQSLQRSKADAIRFIVNREVQALTRQQAGLLVHSPANSEPMPALNP